MVPKPLQEHITALRNGQSIEAMAVSPYEDIVFLAASLCNTPIASISVLEEDSQYFIAQHGIQLKKAPVQHSFCLHAVQNPDALLEVEDAREDAHFKDNPLVTGQPHIVFYAGIAIKATDGKAIGTLHVADQQTRKLSEAQRSGLKSLGRQVEVLLREFEQQKSLQQIQRNLAQQTERLQNIIEATKVGTWEWNVQTGDIRVNEQWANIVGYTLKELEPLSIATWYHIVHPEDRAYSDAKLQECMEGKIDFYNIECRLVHKDGHVVWINDRGQVTEWDAEGKALWMSGTHTEITERKRAELQLKERVKELSCLTQIAQLGHQHLNSETLLQSAAEILPSGFQFPAQTHACISLDGQPFCSKGYKERKHALSIDHKTQTSGQLKITVNCHPLPNNTDPNTLFLPEERQLLHNVATNLGLAIDMQKASHHCNLILQSTEEGVFGIDTDGKCTFINPAAARILGYSQEALVGENILALIHRTSPDGKSIPQSADPISDIFTTKKSIHTDLEWFSHKSGKEIPVRLSATPILENDAITGAVIIFNDISAQRQAQEELQKREARYRALVEHGGDAIAILDATGAPSYVSSSISRVLGYTEEEALQLNLFDLIHPEDAAAVAEELAEIVQVPGKTMEGYRSRVKHKDGTWRWIEATITNLLDDPHIGGIVDNFRDVTEKVLAEKQLEESETHLKEAQQLAKMGSWNFDFKHDRLTWSDALYDVFGVTRAQFEETHGSFLNLIVPEDRERARKTSEHTQKTGDPFHIQYRIITPGGEEKVIEEYGFGEKDSEGNVVRLFGTAQDVTELVEAKAATQAANERFELIMHASSECISEYNPANHTMYLSDGFSRLFGYSVQSEEKNFAFYKSLIHQEDKERVTQTFEKFLHDPGKTKLHYQYRMRKKDGGWVTVEDKTLFVRADTGKATRIISVIRDITTEYFYRQLESIEKDIITRAFSPGATLEDVMEHYLRQLEDLLPGMKATVVCIEDGHLKTLSAPSMPSALTAAIDGQPIGPRGGSCGTAAYYKNTIVVPNVFESDYWADYIDLARKYRFSACWSQPIFNADGEVIATFANYYEEPKSPNEMELHAVERSKSIVSLLMANFSYIASIKAINERFQLVNKATQDALYDWNVKEDRFFWSEAYHRLFGYTNDEAPETLADWAARVHPADLKEARQSLDSFFADQKATQWKYSYRYQKADETYAWVDEIGYLLRDAKKQPLRMIGVLRDVSESRAMAMQKEVEAKVASFFKADQSLEEVTHKVLTYLAHHGSFQLMEIWQINRSADQLYQLAQVGYGKPGESFVAMDRAHPISFSKGKGLPGLVWQHNKLVILEHIGENPQFSRSEIAARAGLTSVAGIPLWHNQQFVGVLLMGAEMEGQLHHTTLEVYTSLSGFLGGELVRKQQEEEMQILFDSAPEILAMVNPKGYFTKVNTAFSKITGFSAKELMSHSFHHFIHPADLESTEAEFSVTITGERHANNYINRWRTKEGGYRWISWNSSPVFGKEGLVFSFGRDVTELKNTQELLDAATALARVGAWEADLEGQSVFLSNIAQEILDINGKERISWSSLTRYIPEERLEHLIDTAKQTLEKEGQWDLELPITTASGHERWVRCIGKVEKLEGEWIRLHGSIQDIHHQKALEIRLKNITDNVPGLIYRIQTFADGTSIFTSVSARAKEIWGYDPESTPDLLEKVHKGMEAGGDYAAFRAEVERSRQELTPIKMRMRYVMPNGAIRYHDLYSTPHRLPDKSTIWDSLVLDVTHEEEWADLARRTAALARIGSWEVNLNQPEPHHIYCSPILCQIIGEEEGYSPEFNSGFDLFSGKYHTIMQEAVQQLITKGKSYDIEVMIQTRQGEKKWVRCIGKADSIRNKTIKIYGSFQDIHTQKTAELALQAAFEERERILESIGDAFFAVDKDWVVEYWNQQAEELLDMPREKVLGKNLWTLFEDFKDDPIYQQYQQSIIDQEPAHMELYYTPKEIWLDINAYPSADGLSVFFRDITLKKESEKQLKASNERFEKVAEATSDAIWDWNIETDTLFWGAGFERSFGYKLDNANLTLEAWEKHLHPDDRAAVVDSVMATVQSSDKNKWQREYRFQRADGTYATVLDRGIVIRNKAGKATRMIGAMTDISDRKAYEASLKKLNASLKQRARELAISNAELEQFAYVASHDLQEPLRMVSSFLSQLEKKYGEKLDEKAQQYIYFAVDGAHRMRQIILDLLEFSRIGKHDDTLQPIALSDIVAEVEKLLHRKITNSNATIRYEKLPTIKSYHTPMVQIFQNLIGNALKYARTNTPPVITIKAKKKKKEWIISVEDNGIGIAEEYYDKVFVIFQRLHAKDKYGGTGMGLALVKKNVESLGGRVWVTSTVGKGSTFYFSLPVK